MKLTEVRYVGAVYTFKMAIHRSYGSLVELNYISFKGPS